jgi:hypothetical protein
MSMAGRLKSENRKLATMNWFTIFLLPPSRSVITGMAVTGGTEACIMMRNATGYGGFTTLSLLEGLLAPGEPVHRVVGMLE